MSKRPVTGVPSRLPFAVSSRVSNDLPGVAKPSRPEDSERQRPRLFSDSASLLKRFRSSRMIFTASLTVGAQ